MDTGLKSCACSFPLKLVLAYACYSLRKHCIATAKHQRTDQSCLGFASDLFLAIRERIGPRERLSLKQPSTRGGTWTRTSQGTQDFKSESAVSGTHWIRRTFWKHLIWGSAKLDQNGVFLWLAFFKNRRNSPRFQFFVRRNSISCRMKCSHWIHLDQFLATNPSVLLTRIECC